MKTGATDAEKTGGNLPKTIDEYLAGVPEPARGTLQKIRAAIRAAAPDATECISYRMPAFRHGKLLVSFAAFSKHCSLFPMSNAVFATFQPELAKYETSKGTIRFPVDKPLPAALVRKIVKARLAENGQK